MNNKGIVRKLDELGRVTLPIEYRRTAGINSGDRVGIVPNGQTIHIILIPKGNEFVGMDRPIDELGRVTLPIEIRRTLNINERQKLDIYVEGKEIYIQKVGCFFCSSENNLREFKGIHVCEDCIRELSNSVDVG